MPVYIPRQGNGGGGSGTPGMSGNLTVQSEGVTVAVGVDKLNFVGADVTAQGGVPGCATIYIPPPDYVSNYNDSNGNNNATVGNVSTDSRHIAAPTAEGVPFSIGTWSGGDIRNTLRDATIGFVTNDEFALTDLTSTFQVTIYDADGVSVLQTRTTGVINGNSDTTVNDIRVQITGFTTDIDRYKAVANVEFNLSNIIPNGGRFSIEIVHQDTLGNFSKTQNDIFYDPDSVTATLANVSITEDVLSSSKYLSGIRYYDLGDTFDIAIGDIDNINHSSYPTNFVLVNSDSYGISDYTLDSGDLTGWTTAYDNTNASYAGTETVDTPNYRAIGSFEIGASPVDWTVGTEVDSPSDLVLIDTYAAASDDSNEEFRDEDNRRTEAFGVWDSTTALTSADLMVQNDRLMVQQGDWTGYSPTNVVDYTASGAATQYFFRGVRDDGISHSNVILRIGGLTEAELTADDVVIEVSLDGTNWLLCNDDWIGTTGTLPDGEPVRINKATYDLTGGNPGIQITLGSGPGGTTLVSTGPDGWGLYVRISMPSSSTVELEYVRADW